MGILTNARLWRFAFAASALFAVIMASLPQPPIPGNLSDTLLHVLAFTVLTVLARLGYPQARTWHILMGLGALGAGIELIQTIPALQREASLSDWLVDIATITAVTSVIAALRCLSQQWLSRYRPTCQSNLNAHSKNSRLK